MHSDLYLSEDRLRQLLETAGLRIDSETSTDFLCFCCFHHNTDSPAFVISKKGPHPWLCNNGKCAQRGNILTLFTRKGYGDKEAKRLILNNLEQEDDLLKFLNKMLQQESVEEKNEWADIQLSNFKLHDSDHGWPARTYLQDRNIGQEAYDYFEMGYSPKKRMLVIPVHDDSGQLQGIIGRSIDHKRYQYSNGLKRASLIWNAHRAIAAGSSSIILCEGALDAVAIWNVNWLAVGAVLGSSIGAGQWRCLMEHFEEVICFFDNDDAGKALTNQIMQDSHGLAVYAVTYPERLVDSRLVKDPGELTTEEINYMLLNKKSAVELILADMV